MSSVLPRFQYSVAMLARKVSVLIPRKCVDIFLAYAQELNGTTSMAWIG